MHSPERPVVQAAQGWAVTIMSDKFEVANDAAFGREVQAAAPAAVVAPVAAVAPGN